MSHLGGAVSHLVIGVTGGEQKRRRRLGLPAATRDRGRGRKREAPSGAGAPREAGGDDGEAMRRRPERARDLRRHRVRVSDRRTESGGGNREAYRRGRAGSTPVADGGGGARHGWAACRRLVAVSARASGP